MIKHTLVSKIVKTILSILEFVTPVFVSISLVGLLIETVKYRGFIQNHFLFDPFIIFASCMLLSALLIVFDSPKNYWWMRGFGGLLQRQSKIFLPLLGILFVIFLGLESLNYPNYVFSNYHIDLKAFYATLPSELFILVLPGLAVVGKKYLKQISTQLELSEGVTGLGLIITILICLLIRAII